MLARTQPGDGVNHCRGATNKTKQQQGRAGILRRFRRAGKGPHNQLLLFTSGLMEKEPFFSPFPRVAVLSSRNAFYLSQEPRVSHTSEKWDTSF